VADTPQDRDEWMNIIRVLVPSKVESNPIQHIQPEQPPHLKPPITRYSQPITNVHDQLLKISIEEKKRSTQSLSLEDFHRMRSPIVNSKRAPPLSVPMEEIEFTNLMKELESATFKISREDVLRTASQSNYFTCHQLSRMIENLSFAEERITVCRIISPRIIDPQNYQIVLQRLTFESEKQRVQTILEYG
jgi:hypothetical protein